MRDINVQDITNTVAELCIRANLNLPKEIEKVINDSIEKEESQSGKDVLRCLTENIKAAEEMRLPVCQDTGLAVVFLEVGQEVHITGGSLTDAVNKGVGKGYTEGALRCSIVKDPLDRVNTGDNTPAVIHTDIVSGDKLKITVAPKGFGSENMSAVKMFNPSVSRQDILNFIKDTVERAGSNPCPPVIVGVGIGGNFEYCAYLAKKALLRDITVKNSSDFYSKMEKDALELINKSGIGPQGFGGRITALAVNIEHYPTHIAGLPVAVNMSCHVTRHCEAIL